MSRISFEGIGEVAATFACGEGVKAGQVVKLTGDGTVGPCGDGERFCGVALSAGEGFAAVQMGGLIRVAASGGALTEGWLRRRPAGQRRDAHRRRRSGGAGGERRRRHPPVRKGGMELWDIVLTT